MGLITPLKRFVFGKFLRSFALIPASRSILINRRLFFSKYIHEEIKRDLVDALGISSTNNLGKYLGIRIRHGRNSSELYADVIDRVQQRLTSWKAKNLSLAGRMTLIQSVTSALPTYTMQSCWLPTKVCSKLDQLNRDFFWGSNSERRKVHLVGWNKVVREKKKGGLGLREARKANMAMLGKVGWKSLTREPTLWNEIFQRKYLHENKILDHVPPPSASPTWKGIVKSFKALETGVKWRICNGRKISLWFDIWVGNCTLCEVVNDNIDSAEVNWMVDKIIDENGLWNLDILGTSLLDQTRREILKIPLPFDRDGEDTRIWAGNSNGKFSCRSAYSILAADHLEPERNAKWSWIWALKSPNNLKTFAWLCQHNKLLTNSLRFDRQFAATDTCVRCNRGREDVHHTLVLCPMAARIWEFVVVPTDFARFQFINSPFWFEAMLKGNFRNIIAPSCPWDTFCLATCWCIWKARNRKVFDDKEEPPKLTIIFIQRLAEGMVQAFHCSKEQVQNLGKLIVWKKPAMGWFKLNTDGSYYKERGSAAAGGLVRNAEGEWQLGFSMKLGDVTIMVAELMGLREGLKLAWDRRFERIEVEVDSLVVFNLLHDEEQDSHSLGLIVKDCKKLLREPWEVRILHTKRDGNQAVDYLAKLGHEIDEVCKVWEDVPVDLTSLLYSEAS